MRFAYSVHVRCACTGPDGKLLGQRCPKLRRKDGSWNSRHGSAGYATRIPTSTGPRLIKRFGYPTKTEAEAAAVAAGKLLDLAGTDEAALCKIGDMIATAKRGAVLPAPEDVRRRLALGLDPGGPGVTFRQVWEGWLSGNKRLRASARRRLEGIGKHWLLPVLADVPLERLNGTHCAAVFERIEMFNGEIESARRDGRRAVLPGDVRQRPVLVGVASQHRVFAALRTVLNFEVKVTHRLPFNPVYAVRLEPEQTQEAQRWSADQAARFLAVCAGDPLAVMFRIAVLRGARRGELVGFRWSGADLDAGYLSVERPILQLGGRLHEEKPKTRDSRRKLWLDAATIRLLREHRKAQLTSRLRVGEAWQDNDLIFSRDDGSPFPPDYVYRRFRALAKIAGVPVIKLHEGGRHTGASLARDAAVDPEIRRKTLGHADAAMTSHYTHIEQTAHRAAAEAVAALVDGRTAS